MVRITMMIFALVLALVACGPQDGIGAPDAGQPEDGTIGPGPDAGDPDGDAAGEIDGGPAPEDGQLQRGEIRDDVRGAEPAQLERVEVVDDRTLTPVWFDGVEECRGIAAVDVTETDDAVTITVSTGAVGPEDQACIMLALEWGHDVDLEAPLGDREVIDGATDEPVEVED